jgi:hypothetical protein
MAHFQEHGEDDGNHVNMGIELLNQASPKEIEELREPLSEGWNMITLLCDRFADIARADHPYRATDTTPPTKPAYN